MDAVRCYVDDQPRSWDKYLSPLAGALRSAVDTIQGIPVISLCWEGKSICQQPSESFQNRGELGVDHNVSDLHKQILKTHELDKGRLKSSQKSTKRDCDLRFREQKFKVGDLV